VSTVWIAGGRVYDSARRRFARADVLVEGGVLTQVKKRLSPPAGARKVDASDHYLLPGLIDCHVHLALPPDVADPLVAARRSDAAVTLDYALAAERTLLGGVTTARDVGGWNHVEFAVRAAIEAGRARGPRLFLAGKLLSITTGGAAYYPGMYDVADGPEQVRAAARRQLAAGADLLKVMATGALLSSETEDAGAIQFRPDELEAAVTIARDNRKHVAAHAHALAGIRNAVQAGCDSIEHGTYADRAVLRLMAKKGTYLVPTNCPFDAALGDPTTKETMPAHLLERLATARATHRRAIALAYRLGVPIAMGTDAGTPGNHHGKNVRECELMVTESGMKPSDVLHAATLGAAALLRQERRLGSLEEGKLADVIACAEDPLADIGALASLALVMKDGTIHRCSLDGAAG
jgi:imidazolonepropionase-like amidohydrolase